MLKENDDAMPPLQQSTNAKSYRNGYRNYLAMPFLWIYQIREER